MKKCLVEGCKRIAEKKGLCDKHYLRSRRKGIDYGGRTREEIILEFISHCLNRNTDNCLIPDFQPNQDYPVTRGKKLGWIILEHTEGVRPTPEHVMRHLCGVSRCCNPKHLTWGTSAENASDRKDHGTEPDRGGTNNGNSRLSNRQKEFIRKNWKRGRGPYDRGNTQALARKFRVDVSTIREVAKS